MKDKPKINKHLYERLNLYFFLAGQLKVQWEKRSINQPRLYGIVILSIACGISTTSVNAAEAPLQLVSESEFFQNIAPVEAVTRLPQPKSETPAAVTIIDRDMIQASGARYLADVFRLVPGFQVAYFDLDIPIVTYHGLADVNSRRMLVLIDGRSAYGAFSGNVNWQNLNIALDDIERIEVIRGPNTVTYGDNAFLATVNILTRHASQTQGVSTHLTVGNHDIADVLARYGTHFDGGDVRISVGYNSEYNQDRELDYFDMSYINLRADLQPGLRDSILFELGYGETDDGVGAIGSTFSPPSEQNRSTHSELIAWQHQFSDVNKLKLQFYHNFGEQQKDFVTGPFNAGPLGIIQVPVKRDAKEERYDVELQHTFNPFNDIRLAWGIGGREDKTYSEAFFTSTETFKNRSSRVFGSVEWKITQDTIINAGGMWEDNDITGTDFSPRLALNYHINNQHTIRTAWSQANRIPSLVEQNADQRLTFMGTLLDQKTLSQGGLESETMNSIEIGYLGRFPDADLTFDMRLYRDQIKNFITDTVLATPDFSDNEALSYENGGEITVDGLDIELTYRPDRDTRIVLTNAFMDASATNFSSNSVYTAEQYEETVPKYSGSLFAMRRITPDWHVSLGYYWVDEMRWLRRSLDSNKPPLKAYTRTDVRLARRIRLGETRGELALMVQNAGDDYQDFRNNKPFSTRTYVTLKLDF